MSQLIYMLNRVGLSWFLSRSCLFLTPLIELSSSARDYINSTSISKPLFKLRNFHYKIHNEN